MFEWERFNMLKKSNVLEPIFTSDQNPTLKRPSFLNEFLLKKYKIKSKIKSSTRFAKSSSLLQKSVNLRNCSLNNSIRFPEKLLSISQISYKRIENGLSPKLSLTNNNSTSIEVPRKAISPEVFKNLNISSESPQKFPKKMIIEGIKNSYFSPKSTTTVEGSSYTYTKNSVKKNENMSLSHLSSNIRLLKRIKKHQIYNSDHLKPFSTRMLSQTPVYKKSFLIP